MLLHYLHEDSRVSYLDSVSYGKKMGKVLMKALFGKQFAGVNSDTGVDFLYGFEGENQESRVKVRLA